MDIIEYHKNYILWYGVKLKYKKLKGKEKRENKRLAKKREDEWIKAFNAPALPCGTTIGSY